MQSRWTPKLAAEEASAATAVAREVATGVTDPARLQAARQAAARETAYPGSVYWEPSSVAQGDAGLALLYAYMDACFPEEGWDVIGHDALSRAARGVEGSDYLPPGLFVGLSGLAFSAWMLSRDGRRYGRMLHTLDAAITMQATAASGRLQEGLGGIPVSAFDVISGLAGVGAYLLTGRWKAQQLAALEAVLESLVTLAQDVDGVAGWYTPAHLLGDTTMANLYPQGNLNCGLAHGIPGPLALLSLSLRHGIAVNGSIDSVHRIASWLLANRADDRWGINWPTAVPKENGNRRGATSLEPSRSAWCYGTPGVARSLWLAGQAIDDHALCDVAVEAMKAVYRRPLLERRIDSPTFCHGVAGLLQVTLRFAQDTGLPEFASAANALTDQLLRLYEPDSILGYRSFEPSGQRIDQPGLLDGAPGVALVLLAAATTVEPIWDRLFLLS